MRARSPECPCRARSGALGPLCPAPSPRRGRVGPGRAGGSDGRPSGPPAVGRGARSERRERPRRSSLPELADFDRAAILEVWVVHGEPHGLIVIGGLDEIESAENLLGLAVGAIGGARTAALGADDASDVVAKAFGVLGEWLLGPGAIFLDRLLHVFGTGLLPFR